MQGLEIMTREQIITLGSHISTVVFTLVFITFVINIGVIIWFLVPRKEY